MQPLSWPSDLPMAELVSCRMAQTAPGRLQPVIYVMLPEKVLSTLAEQFICRRFLFIREPHPMLLWAMALGTHTGGHGEVQWLRSFFDLQVSVDRYIVQHLCQQPHLLLFYALETARLSRQFSLKLEFRQRDLLEAWLRLASQLHPGNPAIAKRRLREQLDQLKPQLLQELSLLYE